jgi:rhodanese-related sulfurtransferase
MKRLIFEIIIIFSISAISGIFYAFIKKIELFPSDTKIYIFSKKYPEIKLLKTNEILKMKDIIIVDARERIFYEKGHIKGAINIPYDEIEISFYDFLKKLDKNKEIVIYCEGGYCEASFVVAEFLIKNGFKNICVYIDGYPEWEKRGLPCEKDIY